MTLHPETADFALDEMPGNALHALLHSFRERGPVQPARFLGLACHVISSDAALGAAFRDDFTFPGHRMYQASFEPAIGASFISDPDPASHLRYRKLATPAFRSRAVSSYAQTGLAALAHELVDALETRDEFDLVADFTARFPYLVISRLLGLPREREDEFHSWALALLSFRDDPERAMQARREFSDFLAPVVEDRRRAPREDVISALVQSEVDGRRLDDDEIASHVRLLFPTGGETTHGALGNLLYALLSHEGEWQRIVDDPGSIEAAVEEGLRWETPIAVLPRMSRSEPVEFLGTKLPPDSWVLFAVAGANRDPALLDDPDRFDPRRPQPPNLVFGRGAKSCPGLHLARRNMVEALRVIAERMPELELVEPESAQPRRTVLRSPDALSVRRRG
jgi:cytochrome P450